MSESEVKLAKVKKSAGVGEKVSKVLLVFSIIAFVATFVSGIVILCMGDKFDEQIKKNEQVEERLEEEEDNRIFGITIADITTVHSDVDFIQDAIDDHPLSVGYGLFLLMVSIPVAILCVVLVMIKKTFALLVTEDSPFTDAVKKRVLITMIVLSGLALMTSGLGAGAVGALLTWLVYTILDYGKTLQDLSDETL